MDKKRFTFNWIVPSVLSKKDVEAHICPPAWKFSHRIVPGNADMPIDMQLGLPYPSADMRMARDSNGRRPVDIARQLQHARLIIMLDPEVPLRAALSQHNHRSSLSQGCLPLSVLAGRVVQVHLLLS